MYAYKDFYGGKTSIPTPGGYSYLSHMGMCRPKEYESGYDFAHFGLELDMVFEETTGCV